MRQPWRERIPGDEGGRGRVQARAGEHRLEETDICLRVGDVQVVD